MDEPRLCFSYRVSRSWKYLVSRKEINEVVTVDRSCLFISAIYVKPYVYRVKNLFDCAAALRDFHDIDIDVDVFRRHGLLGDHVRVLIYNGCINFIDVDAHRLAFFVRVLGMK